MASRRPLVNEGGYHRELPAGDSLLGVPVSVPVLLNSGSLTRIAVTSNNTLPVLLSTGASSSIPVVINA